MMFRSYKPYGVNGAAIEVLMSPALPLYASNFIHHFLGRIFPCILCLTELVQQCMEALGLCMASADGCTGAMPVCMSPQAGYISLFAGQDYTVFEARQTL